MNNLIRTCPCCQKKISFISYILLLSKKKYFCQYCGKEISYDQKSWTVFLVGIGMMIGLFNDDIIAYIFQIPINTMSMGLELTTDFIAMSLVLITVYYVLKIECKG